MPIARTRIPLKLQLPVGPEDDGLIEGKVVVASSFAVTDSSDTTAVIYVGGCLPWEIINESGGAATLTFSHALTQDGTSLVKYDQDSQPVEAITLADDASQELYGLSGVLWLVITAAAPASGFTLICKR